MSTLISRWLIATLSFATISRDPPHKCPKSFGTTGRLALARACANWLKIHNRKVKASFRVLPHSRIVAMKVRLPSVWRSSDIILLLDLIAKTPCVSKRLQEQFPSEPPAGLLDDGRGEIATKVQFHAPATFVLMDLGQCPVENRKSKCYAAKTKCPSIGAGSSESKCELELSIARRDRSRDYRS